MATGLFAIPGAETSARPTTTFGEAMSFTQGVMSDPRVSNSISRLIRQSKQHRDIKQALMAELQSGVLGAQASQQANELAKYHGNMDRALKAQAKIKGVEAASAAAGPGALGSAAISAAGVLIGKAIDTGLFEGLFDSANNPDGSMPDVEDMNPDDLAELQRLTKKAYETNEPMISPEELTLPNAVKMQPTREVSPVGMTTAVEPSLSNPLLSYSAAVPSMSRLPGGQSRNMPASIFAPAAPAAPAAPVAPVVSAAPIARKTDSLDIGDFSPEPFERPDRIDLSLPQKREMPAPSYADTEMAQQAAIDKMLAPESPKIKTKSSEKLKDMGKMTIDQAAGIFQDPKKRANFLRYLEETGLIGGNK